MMYLPHPHQQCSLITAFVLLGPTPTNLAEAQFSCDFIHGCCFRIVDQFQAVLSGILKQGVSDSVPIKTAYVVPDTQYG